MSDEQTADSRQVQVKAGVEAAIVSIYDAAYALDVNLTPIDEAVDQIRDAMDIRLVDCSQCGETILVEHAQLTMNGDLDQLHHCRGCAKEGA